MKVWFDLKEIKIFFFKGQKQDQSAAFKFVSCSIDIGKKRKKEEDDGIIPNPGHDQDQVCLLQLNGRPRARDANKTTEL